MECGLWCVILFFVYIFLQHSRNIVHNGLTSIAKGGGPNGDWKTSCEKWWAPGPVTWHNILWPPCPKKQVLMSPVHFWGQSGLLIHKSRAEIFKWERRCMVNLCWGSMLQDLVGRLSSQSGFKSWKSNFADLWRKIASWQSKRSHKTKCHLSAVQQREPKEMILFLRMLSVFKQQLANS
jgi:hypothetical protein